MDKIIHKIRKVSEFLYLENIRIPEYQRPYKWSEKNVLELINDIIINRDKSAYRLGTAVIHKDSDGFLNIVDGQQRLVTLTLIAFVLSKRSKKENDDVLSLLKCQFENIISQKNISVNYRVIENRINTLADIDFFKFEQFFYDKCELVYLELSDISEAFQFFDSQNSRGKDLEPYDLLKAFHLREMSDNTEEERLICVAYWEKAIQNEILKPVFSDFLFRIRRWSVGKSARFFTKNNVDVFKGLTFNKTIEYPYMKAYRINDFFTKQYNDSIDRNIDLMHFDYPFQIDQVIINGKRFFEYVKYYTELVSFFLNTHNNVTKHVADNKYDITKFIDSDDVLPVEILNILRNYHARYRVGDRYVRNLFDCTLLYYFDKFGDVDFGRAIEKIFFWAYKVRIEHYNVQLATVDNLAKEYSSFLRCIRNSHLHSDVIHKHIDIYEDSKGTKVEDLKKIFNDYFNKK